MDANTLRGHAWLTAPTAPGCGGGTSLARLPPGLLGPRVSSGATVTFQGPGRFCLHEPLDQFSSFKLL